MHTRKGTRRLQYLHLTHPTPRIHHPTHSSHTSLANCYSNLQYLPNFPRPTAYIHQTLQQLHLLQSFSAQHTAPSRNSSQLTSSTVHSTCPALHSTQRTQRTLFHLVAIPATMRERVSPTATYCGAFPSIQLAGTANMRERV
jgi:hypothetical protein